MKWIDVEEMTEAEFESLKAMVLVHGLRQIVAMAEYIAEAETNQKEETCHDL